MTKNLLESQASVVSPVDFNLSTKNKILNYNKFDEHCEIKSDS